jgi:hypothetical protein
MRAICLLLLTACVLVKAEDGPEPVPRDRPVDPSLPVERPLVDRVNELTDMVAVSSVALSVETGAREAGDSALHKDMMEMGKVLLSLQRELSALKRKCGAQ